MGGETRKSLDVVRHAAVRRAALAVGIALLVVVAFAPAGSAPAARPAPTTISFSGYTWTVKQSYRPVGPGPNYFSSSSDNVWVDATGRLHLKITFADGHWNCAEVINTTSLGLGTYTFTLDSPVDALDPSASLGLFTWADFRAYNHREIDIEFSRWSNPADPTNGQYVVQPYNTPGNLLRITQPAGVTTSTHSFTWGTSTVAFSSSSASPGAWTYAGSDVPPPGGEKVHMNVWLFNAAPPTESQPVEVIVKSFSFTPLS